MANQNANYYDVIKKDGVTYYLKDKNTIVDIDVENWVQEVRFIASPHAVSGYYGRPTTEYHLRDVKKQFPQVTSLQLESKINNINMSNYLFPNVRHIIADMNSKYRYSFKSNLINEDKVLCNAFCLMENEVLDMHNVEVIAAYALEGCRAQTVINTKQILDIRKHAFHGFFPRKTFTNGVWMIGDILYGVEPDADAILPAKISAINADCDLSLASSITVPNIQMISVLRRCYCVDRVTQWPERIKVAKEALQHYIRPNDIVEQMRWMKNSRLVFPDNEYYTEKDGVIYTKDEQVLVSVPSSVTTFQIPSSVRVIGKWAFSYCDQLVSIQIPDTVQEIHQYAFYNCEKLTAVILSSSTAVWISRQAFSFLPELKTMYIPGCIHSITNIFANCGIIKLILEEGVLAMQEIVLPHLTELDIPSSLKTLSDCSLPCIETVTLHRPVLPDKFFESVCTTPKDNMKFSYQQLLVSLKLEDSVSRIKDGNSTYIPRILDTYDQNRLSDVNEVFGVSGVLKETDSLVAIYQKTNPKGHTCYADDVVQDMMLILYEKTKNETAHAYLTRYNRKILNRYLKEEHGEAEFTALVKAMVLTATGLNHVLVYAQNKQFSVLSAYVLTALQRIQKPKKQSKGRQSFTL